MNRRFASAVLASCAAFVNTEAQTLPKLSDLGLAPVTSANHECKEEDYTASVEFTYEDVRMNSFYGQSKYGNATLQLSPLQLNVLEDDMHVTYKDFVLNEAGCATSWKTYIDDEMVYECSATYNEKNQLLSMQLEGESVKMTWEDDNLVFMQIYNEYQNSQETLFLTYGDQSSNGLIVQAYTPYYDEFGFFVFSGLLGIPSKNLPVKSENRWGNETYYDIVEFSYDLDASNRVSCALITFNGGHTDTTYYSYDHSSGIQNIGNVVFRPNSRKTTRGIIRTLPDGTEKIYDYQGR